jgi:GTP cyclohydrolase I
MCTRGVNKDGVSMVTSAMRGDFEKDRELRRDFMNIIGKIGG